MRCLASSLLLIFTLVHPACAQFAPDGPRLFGELCSKCHPAATYREKSAAAVLQALEAGPMAHVTAARTALERRAIAEFASGKQLADRFILKPIPQATCGVDPGTTVDMQGPSWNGASPAPSNARFQAIPGFSASQIARWKPLWTFAFPGEVNSDAAVAIAGGRLFVGSRSGIFYSLEASTGCIHWVFVADTSVLQPSVVARTPNRDLVIFADINANVYALDAATGQFAWKTKAGSALTGGLVTVEGLVLVPTAETLVALNVPNGTTRWRNEPLKTPTTPAADSARKTAYVSTLDAIVAVDLTAGKILWVQAGPFSRVPALLAGTRLIVADSNGNVRALDSAKQGALLWQTKVADAAIQGALSSDGSNVYVGLAAESPVKGGGLAGVRIADGKSLWTAPGGKCGSRPRCSPAQTQGVTSMPGLVISGSFDGFVRAYQSTTGKVLWRFDTRAEFETVNGIPGRGGSLGGPGPVIAGGILYVNSGYAFEDGTPGNVLMAFSLDGK